MPIYKELSIMLVHVPKTGGTSFEIYMCQKLGIINMADEPMKYLYSYEPVLPEYNHSLQHLTYSGIERVLALQEDCMSNYTVYAIVRNPYERMISELLWRHRILKDSTPESVVQQTELYLNDESTFDNHKTPQYEFITCNKIIIPNIKIMRTETLTQDMHDNGFADFNHQINTSKSVMPDPLDDSTYAKFYSPEFKKIIQEYYRDDFEIFGYEY
jgi:hypothetical protein